MSVGKDATSTLRMGESCVPPSHANAVGWAAHLEEHAALLREGKIVGHQAANVLQDSCQHCSFSQTGHQLGKQEGTVKPKLIQVWGTKKHWTTRLGQGPILRPHQNSTCMTELKYALTSTRSFPQSGLLDGCSILQRPTPTPSMQFRHQAVQAQSP